MNNFNSEVLAGYHPALLENWYRHKYFNNEIDISSSGVEEYTFKDLKLIAGFSFKELDDFRIKDGETVGSYQVRSQLAKLFGTGNPDTVMVTSGANEGLQLVVRSILTCDDEVVTLGPCYHCHDKIALSIGCTVKKWEFCVDSDFSLDINQLETLVSLNTKAIFLNFPHNPTGRNISQGMLNRIVELARKFDCYLVWDGVFQALNYNGSAIIDPIYSYDKTISLGTLSKAYGAPGLRFGWIIGPSRVLASCVRQKDYGNLFVSPFIEFLASKMLAKIDCFALPRLQQATKNRTIVDQWINSRSGFSWVIPNGGVCGLVKLPQGMDDIDFCNKVLSSQGVLLVPGGCFSMAGYVRLGFGGRPKLLEQGLRRLDIYLDNEI